ncbi:hypothetical protein EOK75_03585 [Pseudorhodobacter turbinis]|uniref:Uncharacterized protein n=1 Tax=Pseudorhodobacter turbinis TaxID=2500533 RepID=A0A4P8EE15_9RHOB|nr:hypothetical protein [Pseudorhodobacter turbinis]QCO54949.1 hypothetical protein EOK75_03585 [Pseudorhodobacter turbinis]
MQKKPYIMTCPGICRAAGAGFGLLMAFLFGPGFAADGLRQIKSIGPKLARLLRGLGGGVARDNWGAQARALVSDESAAFSKRVGMGEVY